MTPQLGQDYFGSQPSAGFATLPAEQVLLLGYHRSASICIGLVQEIERLRVYNPRVRRR